MTELKEMTANFSTGFWARPLKDGNVYGYTNDIESLSDDPRNWIVQAATEIALKVKSKRPLSVVVFLDYADDETMADRIERRYGADPTEVARRRKHADQERKAKQKFDYVLTSNNPEQMARELLQIVLSRSSALPQRPLALPGPLADVDIKASLAAPDGLRVEGISAEHLTTRINGWSLDLTLGPRYYQVVYPFLFRRVFDLAQGSSSDMLKRFRERVATESAGIYLKPHEFILASTVERLCIPPRMVCLVSGRSSYARMGVSVELSQIVLQPGHDGTIPLQIRNNMPYPIVIYPRVSIAQAVFFQTISPSESPYNVRARAKYPPHADDVRSRYYLDPTYDEIRSSRPVRRTIDWEHTLNILLLIVAWLTAASWFVSRFPDPAFAAAGRYLGIVFFALTSLTILVRLVRFIARRP